MEVLSAISSVRDYVPSPVRWLGRQIQWIASRSLPAENKTLAIVARLVSAAALVLLSYGAFLLARTVHQAKEKPAPPLPAPDQPQRMPSEEILREATPKVEELQRLYGALQQNLLTRETEQFLRAVQKFAHTYSEYRHARDDGNNGTNIWNAFDEIEANAKALQTAIGQWTHFYKIISDNQDVIEQPKDGNCWLHTSITGLRHIGHRDLGDYTHETLRANVMEWIKKNHPSDSLLQTYVREAIEAHQFATTQHLQEEINSLTALQSNEQVSPQERNNIPEAIERNKKQIEELGRFDLSAYFEHMRKVGSHGSNAELYAISRLFTVNVVVWRDLPAYREQPRRLTNEYDPEISCPGAQHTIHVVLTQEGNHFNYRLPPAASH
jgi:hypothetical protein